MALLSLIAADGRAAAPDHPIITEVFNNPLGVNDGPVGRDPTNAHQEFIEIYLPTLGDLDPELNKDALRLTFYEVEGDAPSSGLGLVNYRIDLPTFDLDPGNGITPGAIGRPSSGVVVLGWVDYVGDPPVELAGTPDSRIAMIHGGITSTEGYTFIAINGDQFSGTRNFPVPVAISHIELPREASSGVIQNGSGVYLLVNRDDPGYVELFDDKNIPEGESADPDLPSGDVLQTSALLDGFAANDDFEFVVTEQPYDPPTGDDIDLETVLPLGGAFSLLCAQVPEKGNLGYARLLIDVAKTTEDLDPDNDDPVADALGVYRTSSAAGPFLPTPGRVVSTVTPPELSIADESIQRFDVLAGTVGRPGMIAANVGGSFPIRVEASPGTSSDPNIMTFVPGAARVVSTGQTSVYPPVEASADSAANHGDSVTVDVTITAENVIKTDPPVENPVGMITGTFRVLKPTRGKNAQGDPFQATTFFALQGITDDPNVTNDFLVTSLGRFVETHLGGLVGDALGNGVTLIDPDTDMSNGETIDLMEEEMPKLDEEGINVPSPAGLDDLVTTVLNSAEMASDGSTYFGSFNDDRTLVRAIRVNIPETNTRGGSFVPTERVHYANQKGKPGDPQSGLTDVTTPWGFELAIIDSNVRNDNSIETGATDDFGLIVEVGRTRQGASVVPGEFVFLSMTGGLQGADIDTLDVPPHGNQTVIILIDLDPLDTVLGCETITTLYLIDAGTSGTVNVIEGFALSRGVTGACCQGDGGCLLKTEQDCRAGGGTYQGDGTDCDPNECPGGGCVRDPEWVCDGDVDGDGQVNPVDSGLVQASFGSTDDQDLCNYDVDCDGQINPVDSGIVQSLFGSCEAPRAACP